VPPQRNHNRVGGRDQGRQNLTRPLRIAARAANSRNAYS
jgi:hypothetical protein